MDFIDLKTQYLRIEEDIRSGIEVVLARGSYIMGSEVFELEEKLASYTGVEHCISCSNGTDALQMVLMAWGIGPGDAVFVPSFTFMSTAEVVRLVGATPYFVDSDPRTYNMDPMCLEKVVNSVMRKGLHRPAVVIPVDLFGLSADYPQIEKISNACNLRVLEDAAQGLGGGIFDKRAGSYGVAGTTSFFPAKPLGCYGDGGAIFTNDSELAHLLKSIRVHGQGGDKYDNVRIGLNARLDTFQASILLSKLKIFGEEILLRQKVAEQYSQLLSPSITIPDVPEGYTSAWAQYSIVTQSNEHRLRIQNVLESNHIPSMVYYRKPLHLQKAYQDIRDIQSPCPVSEELSSRILSLPMHPYLKSNQIEEISAVINSVEV